MTLSRFLPQAPEAVPTWQPDPSSYEGYQVDNLVTPDGNIVARIEDFGYAAYPCAINATTKNLERGGAYSDRVEAILWAERVAGLHPAKPHDARPAFYYDPDAKT